MIRNLYPGRAYFRRSSTGRYHCMMFLKDFHVTSGCRQMGAKVFRSAPTIVGRFHWAFDLQLIVEVELLAGKLFVFAQV